ncbi:hypothetical protein WS68_22250 [Burkholderia sp. TSV86]|nr:hypothetical protein WS68_22250 [Burkholderia sp. TSV86]
MTAGGPTAGSIAFARGDGQPAQPVLSIERMRSDSTQPMPGRAVVSGCRLRGVRCARRGRVRR